jgi:arylsulfatase A-like enzyme
MLPNVILIILDSARRDVFGCYGGAGGLTPTFDTLASEGMLLADHYAAGCGSAQSHVSIFSGQHSARHQMVHNLCDVRPDLITLPRLLRALGYKTFGHTKASFVPPAGHEELFGFDEMVYPGNTSARSSPGWRDRAVDALRRSPGLFNTAKRAYTAVRGRERQLAAAARYFDGHASFRYLRDRLVEWKGTAPVFAYATVLHPHTPYFPPRKYLARVFDGDPIHPQAFDIQANFHAYMNGDFGDASEGMAALKKCYLADLLYGDEQLGTFVDELAAAGILDNSILVVTSDHGEMFGEHGVANHGATVWEELFATPCLIRYPRAIAPGTVVKRLTSALDLVPTILSLIGKREWAEEQTVFDGQTIDPSVGPDDRCLVVDAPPAVLPERFRKYPNVLYMLSVISRAVRTSAYKYLWHSNGQRALFRVGDPEDDAHNQYATNRTEADRLHDRMVNFYRSIAPDHRLDTYPISLSRTVGTRMTNPVVREELRRLGYL